ncbi:MFS transporter [Cysteiniphilum sp. JM-1]|uniref:MFS transporter n=1 Tax=Cysteiniphilum sp. JM-1 TaxID=2610891 RepID=UPI001246E8D2|nr:MFS transporter [Cysteiniphilum sp. JM-1]
MNQKITSIFFLAPIVYAFGWSLDLYAPIMSDIQMSFTGQEAFIFHVAISLFLLVMGVTQLIMCFIFDKVKIMHLAIVAIIGFMLSTLVCVVAEDAMIFNIARILVAVFSSILMLIGAVEVKSLAENNSSTRLFAGLGILGTLSNISSAGIAVYISVALGWRYVFVFLLAYGLLTCVCLWRLRSKAMLSNKPIAISANDTLALLCGLFKLPKFCVYLLSNLLANTSYFLMMIMVPTVLHLFHMSHVTVGIVLTIVGVMYIVGSMAASFCASILKLKTSSIAMIGVMLLVLASGYLCFETQSKSIHFNLIRFTILASVIVMAASFLMSPSISGSLDSYKGSSALAAGLTAAIVLSLTGVINLIAGNFLDHTASLYGAWIFCFSLLMLILFLIMRRKMA